MPNKVNVKIVEEIKNRLKDAKAIILLDYKGINVEEVSTLRNRMRNANVDYFVAKNTFIKIALNELGIDALNDSLVGPTAVAVSKEDEVVPARELSGFISQVMKDRGFPNFKVGYVSDTLFDQNGVIALSKLPAKEQLIAELLSGLNSPIAGLVFTLKGIVDRFVFVVDGISKEKNNI